MSTPWEQFPQIRTHTEIDSGPNEDGGCIETNKQLVKLLKDVQEKQNEYLALKREKWKSTDYSRIARSLLEQPRDMLPDIFGLRSFEDYKIYHSDPSIGEEFFANLLNQGHSVEAVKRELEIWAAATATTRIDLATLVDLTNSIAEGNEVQLRWTFDQWLQKETCCRGYIIHAKLNTNFDRPFLFQAHHYDKITNHKGEAGLRIQPACGKFVHLTVDRKFNTIAYEDAFGILCFSWTRPFSYPPSKLLDSHVGQWRERLAHELVQPIERRSDEAFRAISIAMICQMRCFVVADPDEEVGPAEPPEPGLRCLRDEVTFRGFYNDLRIRLVEERYTTFLHMLPFYGPVGHFGLLSISDYVDWTWMDNSLFNGSIRYVPDPQDQVPWKKYGLELAGLCTGVSMFQFQICVFIDTWEKNWSVTMKRIDEMVTLKLETLDDDSRLRKLVLDNDDDAAVLYFKVLQSLNFFSDTVRSAERYINALSAASAWGLFTFDWLTNETAQVKKTTEEDTKKLLDYNWDIVKKQQHEASSRILQRLERTINEVKSLQSGLFNVQSITAAQKSLQETQKSITLNRYLLVFTIVTIIFLPPTFAATFFGMDAFSLDTDQATRRLFWTVFGVLSGVTYVLSAVGLFGSHVLSTKRERLMGQTKVWWEEFTTRLKWRQSETRPASRHGEA